MIQSTDNDKSCPLCQQLNACAVANNQPFEHCWCRQQGFAPKNTIDRSDLKACLCQRCAQALLIES